MTYIQAEVALAVDFLRFLCAPASHKRTYLQSSGNHRYGVELTAGYYEGSGDLRLLFIVGQEAIVSHSFVARIPQRALEFLNDLTVILTLIVEGEESIVLALAADISDDGGGFLANCWLQLSLSSGRLLEAMGYTKGEPTMAIDDLFGKCCRRL